MLSRTTSMRALVAVTVPCPVSLLLCNGLLPPAAVVVVIANLAVREPLGDGASRACWPWKSPSCSGCCDGSPGGSLTGSLHAHLP